MTTWQLSSVKCLMWMVERHLCTRHRHNIHIHVGRCSTLGQRAEEISELTHPYSSNVQLHRQADTHTHTHHRRASTDVALKQRFFAVSLSYHNSIHPGNRMKRGRRREKRFFSLWCLSSRVTSRIDSKHKSELVSLVVVVVGAGINLGRENEFV